MRCGDVLLLGGELEGVSSSACISFLLRACALRLMVGIETATALEVVGNLGSGEGDSCFMLGVCVLSRGAWLSEVWESRRTPSSIVG